MSDEWVETTLGELAVWRGGLTPSMANPAYWVGGDVPWISSKEVVGGTLTSTEKKVSHRALVETSLRLVEPGSVVIVVRSGILLHTFPVAYVPFVCTVNQDVKAATPIDGVDGRFLAYLVESQGSEFLQRYRKTGTTVQSVDVPSLLNHRVALPPLLVQRRIVDVMTHLDSHLANLRTEGDAGRAVRAATLSSLLNATVEIPADYDAAFDFAEQGPQASLTSEAAMSDEWSDVALPDLVDVLDSMRKPVSGDERAKRPGTVPYYGATGQAGWIDKHIFDEPLVLLGEDAVDFGNPATQKAYVVRGPSWVNNHAHVAAFLNYALMFYPFIPMTTGTTARRKLTRQRLMEAPFALPPFDEQVEIVQAIEVRLSNGDYTDASINASLARGARLRQSILKQAFEGKLVPQDPADEPASVLLERLQANRSGNDRNGTATTQSRPRGRRRKSKTTGREV